MEIHQVRVQSLNAGLSERELARGTERAAATPRHITLGTHNACNAKCIFCLEGSYTRFSLELYKEFFEAKMGQFIRNAESLTFTGFGELLWVPGIDKFFEYVNETLPNTKKIITTNGTPLTPQMSELLLQGDYTIQVSLHATNAALHEKLTRLEGQFETILGNIRRLEARRAEKRRDIGTHDWQTVPFVRLFSVLNAHNIDDTPAFVQMAYDLGVQSVRCFYMTMFEPEHIEMSCWFDQERADRAVREAKALAEELRWRDPARAFEFDLPPLFSEPPAAKAPTRCSDPWQYLYVELMGAVQPCCNWGKHIGNLHQDAVDDLWNGEIYRGLRRGMASGDAHPWCRSCIRYTGYNVANLLSHLTNRPDQQYKLLREIADRGLLERPSDEVARMLAAGPAAAR